jgi:hypothetical protein
VSIERFPVEAGHILCFARAIGDASPVWEGALVGPEPVPAPPTFVQASAQFDPDYVLRPTIGEPWLGSGRTASGRLRPATSETATSETATAETAASETAASETAASETVAPGEAGSGGAAAGAAGAGGIASGLHAEQHYNYHRPLRSGMVLTATVTPGGTWEKHGRKGGRLLFAETVTEYRDETGELIVTARAVGVRTEKVVDSDGGGDGT